MKRGREESERKCGSLIHDGDTVIVYGGRDRFDAMVVLKGQKFSHKWGVFAWDDVIGQPFGARIRCAQKARGNEGHVYMLKPTPELYTAGALQHRTQLIYTTDISVILLFLNLRPGCLVVESGTGSGSLSRAFIRLIAPAGHLYTYEFHEGRANGVREDLTKEGLGPFVTVTHRDACGQGFLHPNRKPISSQEGKEDEVVDLRHTVDAVMLDLPKPWLAIPFATDVLKYGTGRICCYSPCVEQVQQTCEAMRAHNYEEMQTVEVVRRPFDIRVQSLPEMNVLEQSGHGKGEEEDQEKSPNPRDFLSQPLLVKSCGEVRGHSSYLTFGTLYRKETPE